MLKTYRIYKEKAKPATIWVNGQAVTPNFQKIGLFKDFSTRDKDIQNALEKDIRFKSAYFLVYEEKEDKTDKIDKVDKIGEAKGRGEPMCSPEKQEEAKDKADKMDKVDKMGETDKTAETPEIQGNSPIVCEAATSAEAKAFLREQGIDIANFAAMEKLIEVGKENNIEFPNLVISG